MAVESVSGDLSIREPGKPPEIVLPVSNETNSPDRGAFSTAIVPELLSPENLNPAPITYRRGLEEFRGWSDVPGSALLLCKVALACLITAAVISLPLAVGFYVAFILAEFLVGFILGLAVTRVLRSSRVRKRSVAIPVVVLSLLFTGVLLEFAIYLHDIAQLYGVVIKKYATQLGYIRSLRVALAFQDAFLKSKTGFGGLLANTLYHWRNGVFFGFQAAQAIVAIFYTWHFARKQLAAPFCESCGNWMRKPINAAVVHNNLGAYLAKAVASGDEATVLAVTRTAAGVPLGHGCTIARLFRCSSCDLKMVDVVRKNYGKNRRETILLLPVNVSNDFAAALRADPVEEVREEEVAEGADALHEELNAADAADNELAGSSSDERSKTTASPD